VKHVGGFFAIDVSPKRIRGNNHSVIQRRSNPVRRCKVGWFVDIRGLSRSGYESDVWGRRNRFVREARWPETQGLVFKRACCGVDMIPSRSKKGRFSRIIARQRMPFRNPTSRLTFAFSRDNVCVHPHENIFPCTSFRQYTVHFAPPITESPFKQITQQISSILKIRPLDSDSASPTQTNLSSQPTVDLLRSFESSAFPPHARPTSSSPPRSLPSLPLCFNLRMSSRRCAHVPHLVVPMPSPRCAHALTTPFCTCPSHTFVQCNVEGF